MRFLWYLGGAGRHGGGFFYFAKNLGEWGEIVTRILKKTGRQGKG